MGQYFSRLYCHVIIAVKRREKRIAPEFEKGLRDVIEGVVGAEKSRLIKLGACEDHIHLLIDLDHKCSLASLIREIKSAGGRMMNAAMPKGEEFNWQSGWAAFSVSHSNLKQVSDYIGGQRAFHEKISFRDELTGFLRKHEIEFDERFIF